jgi:hypothetical protein
MLAHAIVPNPQEIGWVTIIYPERRLVVHHRRVGAASKRLSCRAGKSSWRRRG